MSGLIGNAEHIWLSVAPVDLRRGIDGLSTLAQLVLGQPCAGSAFVFRNASGNRIKVLLWDGNGFWLLYKRLEEGTFPFAVSGAGRVEIEPAQLAMLLAGIEWKKAKKSSRFTTSFAITKRDAADARSST